MSNALQLVSVSGFSREQVELVKRTVAKGATDDELALFLTLAHKYGLDPFAKEIWCIKRQKKNSKGEYENDPSTPATITTSRDGYLKVAQNNAEFDGLKSFVVRENDVFEIDTETDKVTHKFGTARGKILGAWATCYHKSRRPVTVFADFEEYDAKSPIWSKYPSAMIQKVAEAQALKRQFGISGLVAQEEMGMDPEREAIDITPEPVALPQLHNSSDKDEQAALIRKQKLEVAHELGAIIVRLGVDGTIVRAVSQEQFGNEDPKKLPLQDLVSLRDHFAQMESDHLKSTSIEVSDQEMNDVPF